MDNDIILKWLLQGDVSIQYQVCRDLLSQDRPELRQRIVWSRSFCHEDTKALGKSKVFNYGAVIFVPGKARRSRIA